MHLNLYEFTEAMRENERIQAVNGHIRTQPLMKHKTSRNESQGGSEPMEIYSGQLKKRTDAECEEHLNKMPCTRLLEKGHLVVDCLKEREN